MRCFVTLAMIVCGAGAQARCMGEDHVFMSCTVDGGAKLLSVCIDDGVATYAFGLLGQPPDLSISTQIADLDYTPWPGYGGSIWEEVRFYNNEYNYLVFAAVDRSGPEDANGDMIIQERGGVIVFQGDTSLAVLNCDADSLDFPWTDALSQGKATAGLRWNMQAGRWQPDQ